MARIYVLAGTNGAGKSSIAGAMFRAAGADYFDPDEAARRLRDANPALGSQEANSAAWHQGKRLLEQAITDRGDLAFETTLGGRTITALLHKAIAKKLEVSVWYAALCSVELHVDRVRARVAKGGHDVLAVPGSFGTSRCFAPRFASRSGTRDPAPLRSQRVPESEIRKRYDASRLNLIELLPHLTSVRVYDNSADGDPASGKTPRPRLLLHMVQRRILEACELGRTPTWAKPILMAAFKIDSSSRDER